MGREDGRRRGPPTRKGLKLSSNDGVASRKASPPGHLRSKCPRLPHCLRNATPRRDDADHGVKSSDRSIEINGGRLTTVGMTQTYAGLPVIEFQMRKAWSGARDLNPGPHGPEP